MRKKCKKHGLTEYVKRNDGRCRCKKCAVEAVQKRRDEVKIKGVNYLGGKCCYCGYDKFNGALEFHHINPNEKNFTVSKHGYTRSWDKVKNELNKCVLLCSNCHRELHGGLIQLNEEHLNVIRIDNIMNKKKHYNCIDCGCKISKDAIRCNKCSRLKARKVRNRPSKEILINDINELGYCGTGRKYNVSDNTIRKWLR